MAPFDQPHGLTVHNAPPKPPIAAIQNTVLPEPFFGDHKEDFKHRKAIVDNFIARLKRGEFIQGDLPPAIMEQLRLVGSNTSDGHKFQSYMERLLLKILPSWNFDKQPVRFFISDTPQINASVIPNYSPIVIILNKGLLPILKSSENRLLHVLGHEIGHALLHDVLGDIRISRPEEILVNMPAIQWMFENGVNPQPAVDFALDLADYMDRINTPENTPPSELQKILSSAMTMADEHLPPAFDADLLNTALVAYKSQVAGTYEGTALLTIPEDIEALLANAQHANGVTVALESLSPPFEALSWQEQLGYIRNWAKLVDEGYAPERVETLRTLMMSIENDLDDRATLLGREIIEATLPIPGVFRALYPLVNVNIIDQAEDAPPPPLDGLAAIIQNVTNARSYDAFVVGCEAMVCFIESVAPCPLHNINWPPSYQLPTQAILSKFGSKGVSAPWEQHLEWAKTAHDAKNRTPIRALHLLGVSDPRMFARIGLTEMKQLQALTPITAPAPSLNTVNLAIVEGNTIVRAGSHGPKWDKASVMLSMAMAARQVADRRRQLRSLDKPQRGPATAFVFDGTLPFTTKQGFKDWFAQYSSKLSLPTLLHGRDAVAETFRHSYAAWEIEPLHIRQTELKRYTDGLAQGQKYGSVRHPHVFLKLLSEIVIPYQEHSAEVFKMLSALLLHGKDEGRERVREFFLNAYGETGLATLTSKAVLPIDSPYSTFVSTNPQLFTIQEKARIAGPLMRFPLSLPWWERMLETPRVNDLGSLQQFLTVAEIFTSEFTQIGRSIQDGGISLTNLSSKKLFVESIALNYFTALLGYNYPGQFDLGVVLENPPTLISSISLRKPSDLTLIGADEFHELLKACVTQKTLQRYAKEKATTVEYNYEARTSESVDALFDRYQAEVAKGILIEDFFKIGAEWEDLPREMLMPNLPKTTAEYMRDVFGAHIVAQVDWGTDLTRRAKIYRSIDNLELVPSVEWKRKYREELIKALKAEPDLTVRLISAQTLLAGSPLKDSALRQQAMEIYVAAMKEKMARAAFGLSDGRDNGSGDYLKAMLPDIEWAENNIQAGERYKLFLLLADALESQKDVSYRLKQGCGLNDKSLLNSDGYFRASGALLEYAMTKENGRTIVLEYLMREPDVGSRAHLWHDLTNATALDRNEDLDARSAKEDDRMQFFKIFGDIKEYKDLVTLDFYENFWQAPLPVRVALIDQLLLSPHEKTYETSLALENAKISEASTRAYQRAFNFATDKLFPPGIKYGTEAKVALEVYKDVQAPNERAILISALLAAGDTANSSAVTLTSGERLAVFLSMLGPAPIKFGQGLSNYSEAPLDLRQPLVRLTKRAAPTPRWDFIERYELVVPEIYRQGIRRLGTVKGNGTYQEGIEAEHFDGSVSVMKLQRPNIERRAKAGFDTIGNFVNDLSKVGDVINPSVAAAAEAIATQAKLMSDKETNAPYRLQQVQQAEGYYNSLKITVDAHSFTFHTAAWLAYGMDREELEFRFDRKEWCDEELISGVHFDELPTNTPTQQGYKKSVAKAIVAAEFLILLSGHPIDHDRHIAQYGIEPGSLTIGLLDHGALDLVLPTKREKQLLAQILVSATEQYREGGSLPELLGTQLHNVKKTDGRVPDFLVKVERAALAMSPFLAELTANDLQHVFAAVYQTGTIDPDMLHTNVPVDLPIIGKTTLKFSTILNRALPKISTMKITVSAPTIPCEPLCFTYEAADDIHKPYFPGLRKPTPAPNIVQP